jgi:molybdopterin biosynthesis enzyme MoaB
MYSAIVNTVSDRCARGERADQSGPVVRAMRRRRASPWSAPWWCRMSGRMIEGALIESAEGANLIATTGGTGFSPRDVTPEATASVCDRRRRGFPKRCGRRA